MVKRQFFLEDEWLYLKIYAGIKTSDILLEVAIIPVIEWCKERNYISQFFFIRYNDPKPHIRLRIKLKNTKSYNEVLNKASNVFKKFIDSGEISNISVDVYNREVERYGQNTIEDAEALFCINSEYTLQCLHFDDEEKIIVSLFYIDEVLNRINLNIQEKLEWIKVFNDAFKKEFNADKKLNSQLDRKYREFKPKFIDFLKSEEFSEERHFLISNVEESAAVLQNIKFHNDNKSLEIPLHTFFQSIFHMNINRLFVSNQRVFEMVIYDYLVRYYKTIAYRSL